MIEGPKQRSQVPPHATCVFKGIIFDVWQWEQEMFDGSKQIFERLVRADTVAMVPVLSDGRIMLLKQEQPDQPPFTGLCAGRLEEGETPARGMVRELLEETGFKAKEIVPWFEHAPYAKIEWTVHFFIGHDCEKIAEPILDAGEKIEPYFVDFDGFLEAIHQPNFRDKEIALQLLRIERDPKKMADLKKLFFG